MCGINGCYNGKEDLTGRQDDCRRILEAAHQALAGRNQRQNQRGNQRRNQIKNQVKNQEGNAGYGTEGTVILSPHAALCGDSSRQTCAALTIGGCTWALAWDGELYNADDLRKDLTRLGHALSDESETHLLLHAFLEFGESFVCRLNGVFAIALWDPSRSRLILYRDRSGVKPLFYTRSQDTTYFASEPKGLFAIPGIVPRLDRQGLNEIFSMGPARTPGCGVFAGVSEVLPGHMLILTPDQTTSACYWRLQSHEHEDSLADTIEKTSWLLQDAVRRQMISDGPLCSLLSGGLDSSLVSAICAGNLRRQGLRLDTFSFDFTENKDSFRASDFQPSQDRPYADQMALFLNSCHRRLECSTADQLALLNASVDSHDLPSMADVDASLMHFCSLVSQTHNTALTGECADEIFGGYPWFHKKECLDARTFPWTMDLTPRKVLLSDDVIQDLDMDGYVAGRYEESVAETPRFYDDSPEEARRREIAWLNQKWFMQTLLNRMDRAGRYAGLTARVPFADFRIIEYLWNIPWEMKAKGGIVKGLLRECGRGLLPDEVLFRRKSPYPKTYDTAYETLLTKAFTEMLHDSASPILRFLDSKKAEAFLQTPADYGKPWYGQLMAGPQMLAYLLQVDYWMRKFHL